MHTVKVYTGKKSFKFTNELDCKQPLVAHNGQERARAIATGLTKGLKREFCSQVYKRVGKINKGTCNCTSC